MNLSKEMENKIKNFVKSIDINIQYGKHIEFFQIDNNNLNNIINKIDKFKLDIIKDSDKDSNKDIDKDNNIKIEEEKTKQLELENENLKLKLELYKLSGKMI